ncbi:mitochondrial uncoupling protein 4-like isoform X1 [Littorina saxatilis]|uniref:Mitochondrial uncoupling protein 4 n=1 Tax=Littorina saxatilis TaxID=31220 RepID=A0AAN9BV11_9CAEN
MATKAQESFVFKYGLSVTAACVAETVTYPLDLTKTRLQVQGEHGVKVLDSQGASGRGPKGQLPHRGMLATAVGIVKEEGLRKLWQGVPPALYRHVIYTGCRMSFYEMLREDVFKKNADGGFPVWKASMCGLCAGAMGQFMASPADLVKVNMQMEGKRRLEGKPPRVKNMGHAFRQIVTEAGFLGLWRGWIPNVQRAALVNLGDLATYDTAKHLILRKTSLHDNYVTHSLASVCSGLVAALMGTPADVVKTRVMNQPTKDGKGLLYKGSIDCLVKTVKKEGFLALYKGLLPIWARMAPWSIVFWLTYEEVRKLTGTSSF